jgi:hypothetical protein
MPGGETDLIHRSVLPAGWLSGHKARLRLICGSSAMPVDEGQTKASPII